MTVEDQNTNNSETNSETFQPAQQVDSDVLNKLVEERISENLKPIKEKLDSAYSQRDEALRRLAEYERKEKEAELKRLEEEGKHREVYELRLAEERAAREAAEKRNVELTRDIEVRNALSAYPFRNENAGEMAFREIIGQLVQNEQKVWVHRSGVSIRDFVKGFSESDENSFLFKPKVSSGAGSNATSQIPSSDTTSNKSLFEMSQEEVIKMAQEGKLRRQL